MATAHALFHPVRLRIVQALLRDDQSTTRALHERLRDVPIATLYRQMAHLVQAGIIEAADEQQVRGVSERSYRLAPGFANPTPEELATLSPEQLLTTFSVFSSGLLRDFEAYLEAGSPDLHADRIAFAQADFWASTDETDAFFADVSAALQKLLANEPAAGRRRRTLTTVLIPQPDSDPA